MEEKSNVWFFRFISTQNLKFPIVETGIIINDTLDLILGNDTLGFVKRKNSRTIPIESYFIQLLEENELKNKIIETPVYKICYFYKKNDRKIQESYSIKDLLSKKQLNLTYDIVQKYIPSYDDRIYSAKVLYFSNKYNTTFSTGNVTFTDQIIISNLIDIITMIISSLEIAQTKRVIQLSLEFIKDYQGLLWFSNCSKCVLIEPRLTLNQNLQSEEDLKGFIRSILKKNNENRKKANNLKLNKLKETEFSKKETESYYIFKRGQLRNKSSNLDSPIRVKSPDRPQDLEDSIYKYSALDSNNLSPKPFQLYISPNIPKSFPENLSVLDVIKKYLNSSKSSNKFLIKRYKRPQIQPSVSETQLKIRKKNFQINSKTLPKLSNIKRKLIDTSNFRELVLRTYFKETTLTEEILPKEFGIGTKISCDKYSQLIKMSGRSKTETDDYSDPNLILKPIFEEKIQSRPSTPLQNIEKNDLGLLSARVPSKARVKNKIKEPYRFCFKSRANSITRPSKKSEY